MSSQFENCCLEEKESGKDFVGHSIESPEVESKETNESHNEKNSESDNSLVKKVSEANEGSSPKGDSMVEVSISYGFPNHGGQLEQVLATNTKEETESVSLLKEKLSAALINVSLKDELVKQHAKVAEEAVAGWEKAENEVASVKQQLETAVQQKSTLDEPLKECVRQLRLAKEEQEGKATENLMMKLEFLEKENEALKSELMSQSEELEIRSIERDLSSKAAEAASKQHLESIKMVAKLESECRKLKLLSRKSPSTPTYSIDSVTNSSETSEPERSDSWAAALMAELHRFKNDRSISTNLLSSSIKIDLMDDFLEMERLAAMPENGYPQPKHLPTNIENQLREELNAVKCRAAELEEKVQKLEANKADLETCLENLQVELIENKIKLEELEAEIQEANELKMEFESYGNDLKLEAEAMMSKIESLQAEIDRQRVSSEKLSARCQELEYDLHSKNKELELEETEKEKVLADSQKRLEELQIQIKEAVMKLEKHSAESRNELEEKEKALSESQKCLEELQIQLKEAETKMEKQNAAYNSELEEKQMALEQSQLCFGKMQTRLKEAATKLQMELDGASGTKESLSSELASARGEMESLCAQIDKEQAISAELSIKCEQLKKEAKQKEQQLELQRNESAHIEQKINQEDVASAAGKLAECQKTIASLGNQLKSLATLEDFLTDTASIPRFSGSAPLLTNGDGSELWRRLHLDNVYLPQRKHCDNLQDPLEGIHTFSKYIDRDMFDYPSSTRNGCEKLFPTRRT